MSEANTIKDEAQASATPVASATTTVPAPVPVAVQPQAQPAPQAAPIVQLQHVQAPTFLAPLSSQTQHAIQTKGTPATLNLDDIFEDCFFTPDGDAVFLSETTDSTDVAAGATAAMQGIQVSGETIVSNVASRPLMTPAVQQVQPNPVSVGVVTQGQPGVVPTPAPVTQFAQVPLGGGIATTGLLQAPGERATVMGTATPLSSAPPKLTPMVAPPQQKHHLQYAIPASGMPKRRGTAASARERKMSDQQKTERRWVDGCGCIYSILFVSFFSFKSHLRLLSLFVTLIHVGSVTVSMRSEVVSGRNFFSNHFSNLSLSLRKKTINYVIRFGHTLATKQQMSFFKRRISRKQLRLHLPRISLLPTRKMLIKFWMIQTLVLSKLSKQLNRTLLSQIPVFPITLLYMPLRDS